MICLLGVCHKDAPLAVKWLEFFARLSARESPGQPPLVVMTTQSIGQSPLIMMKRSGAMAEWVVCPDENEDGYPKSASHLFLRAMEYCEKTHPTEPILWLEPDTLPLKPNWRQVIADEYAARGKPFMGQIERGHGIAHLIGCSVYPPDWRAKAPMLASVLSAPDIFWGKGFGQAFDTWAAPETVPQAAEVRSIQQIWRPRLPITGAWLWSNVRPGAALFHQHKDGSGFKVVRDTLRI